MYRIVIIMIAVLFAATPARAAATAAPEKLEDLYLGEVLYYAFQEDWFEAISRLDGELAQYHRLDEPQLDTLYPHIGLAEFAVGDFELAYRMHQRAGRAINAVINGNVSDPVRNEALYRLARIYFHKSQPVNAQQALERIRGKVPEPLQADLAFLQAQVAMANGRFDVAVELLNGLQNESGLQGFAGYNLGIALLGTGNEQAAWQQLDQTGRLQSNDRLTLAMRDKTNLVLGEKLLAEGNRLVAKDVLDRVRLTGPFSDRALLSSGWADAGQENFESALIPWSILAKRDVTDSAVQEALLAVPYAYGKLGVYSRAALLYGHALEVFSTEIDRLSESISSIRNGHFLDALTRPELQQDADWLVRLRSLPEAPETFYLIDLMAANDFQEGLRNYLDLDQLRFRLDSWTTDLAAFEQLIETRRRYYEPLLPIIDARFRQLDSLMKVRLDQRLQIEKRLQSLLVAPRPELLMTAAERTSKDRLNQLTQQLSKSAQPPTAMLARINRLQGVLDWTIRTDFDRRLTATYTHLEALNKDVAALQQQYEAFVRVRQAATQSYQGYEQTILSQRNRIAAARERVGKLLARQGHQLEEQGVKELQQRLARLEEFRIKARFAMADSYDRAALKQGQEGAGQ